MKYYVYGWHDKRLYIDGDGARTREELRDKYDYYLTIEHIGVKNSGITQIFAIDDAHAEEEDVGGAVVLPMILCAAACFVMALLAGISLIFLLSPMGVFILCADVFAAMTGMLWLVRFLEEPYAEATKFNESGKFAEEDLPMYECLDLIPEETPKERPPLIGDIRRSGDLFEMYNGENWETPDFEYLVSAYARILNYTAPEPSMEAPAPQHNRLRDNYRLTSPTPIAVPVAPPAPKPAPLTGRKIIIKVRREANGP